MGATSVGSSGSSSGGSGSSGYSLPAVFRAQGALEDQGAREVVVGDAGPELILPAKYTNLMTAMANAFEGSPEDEFASLFGGDQAAGNIVQSNQINQTISSLISKKTQSVEDEYASLFGGNHGSGGNVSILPNQINQTISSLISKKTQSVEDEYASLFGGDQAAGNTSIQSSKISEIINSKISDSVKTSTLALTKTRAQSGPGMILPTRAQDRPGGLATGSQGSGANIENILKDVLEAVKDMGVDVFIDSDKVGAKIMKKIQRKQGASF
jgi:hypothetical protein